jgi:hypothetical protein
MALTLRNRKSFPYAFAVFAVGLSALWYGVFGLAHGQLFLGSMTAGAAFFFFLYRQHLDETKLFKELFVEFNRRYDRLNSRLNEICRGDSAVPLTERERGVVFDYFNLCAEEFLFFRSGYIDAAVWKTWRSGMAFFFNDPRIRDLWNEECGSADKRASYYGFDPPAYEAWAIKDPERPGIPPPAEPPPVVAPPPPVAPPPATVGAEFQLSSEPAQRSQPAATWQAAPQRSAQTTHPFLVRSHFAHAPRLSVEWSQRFVDAALSYEGVRAFFNDPGVGFEPNFVFIERVYTEHDGFIASFYGATEQFRRYGHEVEPGRAAHTWSRIRVRSPELLERALKCLHISANLKDLDRC